MAVCSIIRKDISFESAWSGVKIRVRVTEPEDAEDIRGVLQIVHGMAEHSGLYGDFSCYMAERGFAVAVSDQLGHGRSVSCGGAYGYFGENGPDNLLRDQKKLTTILRQEYPGLPLILLGHSMGSFVTRAYLARWGTGLSAAVILGTGEPGALTLRSEQLLAEQIVRKKGPKGHDPLFAKLSTQRFNKAFAPNRTPNDWLSRDDKEVDRYTADPLCGFDLTVSGYRDVLLLQGEISGRKWAEKVPDLPILVLSGDKDPVGENGKAVERVVKVLQDTGHHVCWKLYPEARHVVLCETNREEVYGDILQFIEDHAGLPEEEETL